MRSAEVILHHVRPPSALLQDRLFPEMIRTLRPGTGGDAMVARSEATSPN